MVVIGIDAHTRSHTAAAVDEHGRELGTVTVSAGADGLEAEIRALVEASGAPRLLAICGVGPIAAAKILGETHDVGRFPTAAAFAAHAGAAPVPASSGTTTRHRLNRGGNRQLNRALFTVAMVQARWRAEGKSPAEARRCLMRHLAGVMCRAMALDEAARQHAHGQAA